MSRDRQARPDRAGAAARDERATAASHGAARDERSAGESRAGAGDERAARDSRAGAGDERAARDSRAGAGDAWSAWVRAAVAPAGAVHPKVLAAASSTREPPHVRGGGYVVDALEAALWALRTTSTFEDGVLAAVNLGDDADTTAAIYGQLAGAIHGLQSIPERWRTRVHRGDEILAMADALYDLDHSRPAIARYAHVRPAKVVACETPEQVAKTLMTSERVAIRSGGHSFAGCSTTTGTLIDVSPMNEVRLEGERATIGAGARLGAIYDALAPHGRTIVAGCGPTVGIAGLTLGGGIGILGRRHGLTCDQLVAATVVLADGRIVGTDDHPELLWALKGAGGGRFGVVTEFVFETVPAERTTVFDILVARTPETVAEWQRWAPHAPGALAASLLVLDDEAHIFGAYLGSRDEARRQLAHLDGAGRIEELEFRAAKRWLADNGPSDNRERPFFRSGFFNHPIDPPLDCKLDFMPLGGEFNTQRPTRPPTPIATRCSACTWRPPTRRPPIASWTGWTRSASTRTSPNPSATRGIPPTTSATASGYSRSSRPTTRAASSRRRSLEAALKRAKA